VSEHGAAHGDDRVGQVVEAARQLVEAYSQQATSKDDFERLAGALEALDGVGVEVPESEAAEQLEPAYPDSPEQAGDSPGG
jgi:hypothetical protein